MTQTAPAPRLLLEGSEAIADAMIAAGCRFFAGYPMTPFTEILEHMAAKLPDVGGDHRVGDRLGPLQEEARCGCGLGHAVTPLPPP